MSLSDKEIQTLNDTIEILYNLVEDGTIEYHDLDSFKNIIAAILKEPSKEKPCSAQENLFKWEPYGTGLIITKFIGFDEIDIIVPSEIEGKQVFAIGKEAFYKAQNIQSVTLPECIQYIGESCFSGCVSLNTINFPKKLKAIGKSAFFETALHDACLSNGIFYIGPHAFSKTKLEKAVLPDSLYKISPSTFKECKYLKDVYLPEGLKLIDSNAFSDCNMLCFVSLPNSLIQIGYDAFSNCPSLTEIEIPPSVSSIAEYAFGTTYYYQPDRRYNPRRVSEQKKILIKCVPGSYAQEYARSINANLEKSDLSYDNKYTKENTPVFRAYVEEPGPLFTKRQTNKDALEKILMEADFPFVSESGGYYLVLCAEKETLDVYRNQVKPGYLYVKKPDGEYSL